MTESVSSPEEQPGKSTHKASTKRRLLLGLVLAIALFAIYWPLRGRLSNAAAGGKNSAKGAGKAAPATPVVAARASKGDIGQYFNGLGAVTPIYTDIVRSRVDGELMNVRYREGETVQKGDLLIEIDPRPYQVQLEQAEGQLLRDQAALENARLDLARYNTLLQQNAIAEQMVATQKALVAQDEGVVKSDQGQIDSAKLNLTYSKITAPIGGLVGLRLVDPGNIVHASDTNGLLVITQMDPISVLFTVSEDQLPLVLQKMRGSAKLVVEAYDRDMKKKLSEGTLTTVDNQIDQTTGTVRLRATFDNKTNALFPNQFVNARLLVEERRGVVLIPNAAVQRSGTSTFVYLVTPQSTVTLRTVSVGVTEGANSEITSGLQAGDVVIVAGVDKLQEGTPVTAQIPGENPAPSPAKAPPAKGGKGK